MFLIPRKSKVSQKFQMPKFFKYLKKNDFFYKNWFDSGYWKHLRDLRNIFRGIKYKIRVNKNRSSGKQKHSFGGLRTIYRVIKNNSYCQIIETVGFFTSDVTRNSITDSINYYNRHDI